MKRCAASWDLGGGDDDVGEFRGFGDEVAAAVEGFFGEFASVATFVLGGETAEVDIEKLCAERTDLFAGGSADVVGFNDGAEAAGSSDGL